MKTKKKNTNPIEGKWWILPAVLSVTIFALAAWGFWQFNQFLLFDDEFGYWTGSAYLTGTDWISISSGIPYYSYGYGFFILTPIRLLFPTGPLMYKAALVVNSLLLVGSFWIARYVTAQLFPKTDSAFRDIVCALCQVYPAYLVFSHIAWAECFLVFAFWVFVWLSLRVINKPSVLNHVGVAATVMLLYVIHQRTLAVAIATVMVMIWMFVTDPGRRSNVIVFGITMGVLMLTHSLIKTDLLDQYYHNRTQHYFVLALIPLAVMLVVGLFYVDRKHRKILLALGAIGAAVFAFYMFLKFDFSDTYTNNTRIYLNELSGQMNKLKSILTVQGFAHLIQSIMGKWFYLTMSSLLAMWWSAEAFGRKLIEYGGELKDKKKAHQLHKMETGMGVWYVWLLLTFVGSFMISAIYMIETNRNDVLLYGRYVEHMLGIYIIIGVMALTQDKNWLKKMGIYAAIGVVCGWICEKILDGLNMTTYQAYHCVYTAPFLEKGEPVDGGVWNFTIFAVIFCVIGVCILKAGSGSRGYKPKTFSWKLILPVGMTVMFCYIAYGLVFGTMAEKQELRVTNICAVADWLDKVDQGEGHKIYYCEDTESRYWSESFQFLLKDRPVTMIKSSDIDLTEEAFYLSGDGFVDFAGYQENMYCIRKSYQFAVSVPQGTELENRAKKLRGEIK